MEYSKSETKSNVRSNSHKTVVQRSCLWKQVYELRVSHYHSKLGKKRLISM